jgi:vanillate O-demethylase ferredoxin subunit
MATHLLLRVETVERLNGDVALFTLVDPHGQALPAFDPGAHVDVEPLDGLVRQYSLLGDPVDLSNYRIAVKLCAPTRGGSRAMHELAALGAESGALLKVSLPRQNFALDARARRHVLWGAGIGVTPLLSMAHHLQRAGAAFSLDYFASSGHAAFGSWLKQSSLSSAAFVHEGLSRAAIVEQLSGRLDNPEPDTHYYVCGPAGFMDTATHLAQARGAESRLHLERFDPASPPAKAATVHLRLARSGLEFSVPPEQTLADALLARGVACPTSCRQGMCGTCITPVLEGIPDHRDTVLTDEERQSNSLICLCVSRAISTTLVLDV